MKQDGLVFEKSLRSSEIIVDSDSVEKFNNGLKNKYENLIKEAKNGNSKAIDEALAQDKSVNTKLQTPQQQSRPQPAVPQPKQPEQPQGLSAEQTRHNAHVVRMNNLLKPYYEATAGLSDVNTPPKQQPQQIRPQPVVPQPKQQQQEQQVSQVSSTTEQLRQNAREAMNGTFKFFSKTADRSEHILSEQEPKTQSRPQPAPAMPKVTLKQTKDLPLPPLPPRVDGPSLSIPKNIAIPDPIAPQVQANQKTPQQPTMSLQQPKQQQAPQAPSRTEQLRQNARAAINDAKSVLLGTVDISGMKVPPKQQQSRPQPAVPQQQPKQQQATQQQSRPQPTMPQNAQKPVLQRREGLKNINTAQEKPQAVAPQHKQPAPQQPTAGNNSLVNRMRNALEKNSSPSFNNSSLPKNPTKTQGKDGRGM